MAPALHRVWPHSHARLQFSSSAYFARPSLLAAAAHIALLGLCSFPGLAHAQTSDEKTESQAKTMTLGTVTVQTERERPVLGNVTTVEGAELENATGMADAIRNRPLISAPSATTGRSNLWNGAGTTGYNIRGLEGNRIGLDVDGVELPYAASMPDSSSNYATGIGRDYIDPEVFRQVRIASGTPSAGSAEGNGLGGRVSFLTKTPEDYLTGSKRQYIGLKVGYNGADRSWAEAITGAYRFNDQLQALAVYSRRDGHEGKNYGDADTPEVTDWHSNALLTRFVWTPNSSNKFGLTLDLYERKDNRDIPYGVYSSSYPDGAQQTSTTRRNRISLDHTYLTNGNFALFDRIKTTVYFQDSTKKDYTVASTSSYTRNIDTGLYTKTAGLNSEATKQLSDKDTLVYGAKLSWSNERRPWTEYRYVNSTGALSTNYPVSYDRMAETDTTKLALYARDEHRFTLWGHNAIFTPGIRGEYIHTSYGDLSNYTWVSTTAKDELTSDNTGFIAPTLNLTYALTPTFDAYAQYSRGVRTPTASEKTGIYEGGYGSITYGIIGNPDLKNETSNSLEFGTKGEIARGVTLNASAFYSRYKNFIDWQSVSSTAYTNGEYRTVNIANVTIYGAEMSTKVDLGEYLPQARGYSAAVALGLNHGRSKDSDGNKGGVNSVAPAKGSLILAYDDPSQRFGLNFTTTFIKAKKASDTDSSDSNASGSSYINVPGYTRFDLGAYWNVRKNLTVNFALNNLTDKKYWDYSSVRMLTSSSLFNGSSAAGRNASISATLNF